MRYKTTCRCDQDIIDIFIRGVRLFGIDQAERYQEGLAASFDLLALNPTMARKRFSFTPPVRLHRYRAHMIVYVEDEDTILIVRVIHGRQDWERHIP